MSVPRGERQVGVGCEARRERDGSGMGETRARGFALTGTAEGGTERAVSRSI